MWPSSWPNPALRPNAETRRNSRIPLYSFISLSRAIPTKSIDVGPYPIREHEYAFGIRTLAAQVGNKSGAAFEYLRLFRYQSPEVKESFDEVTWGYSKYSEPGFRPRKL
jgi:hypothetical protein